MHARSGSPPDQMINHLTSNHVVGVMSRSEGNESPAIHCHRNVLVKICCIITDSRLESVIMQPLTARPKG